MRKKSFCLIVLAVNLHKYDVIAKASCSEKYLLTY